MRLILRLAFRNLLRNKRRSTLTLLAVLIPVALLDLVWGLTGALERSLFENTVRLETGHLQVHRAGYRLIGHTLPLIRDVRSVLDALGEDPQIEWFTVRLELPALVTAGGRSRGALLQGIEPERSERISLMRRWVSEGRYLTKGDTSRAVVGSGLLKKLDLSVGGRLIALVSHPEIGTGVLLPEIVGVIEAPTRELSRAVVQITLEDARSLARSEHAATSVIALVQGVAGPWDTSKIGAVAERLQRKLGEEFIVETWEELAPQAVGFLKLLRPINGAFMMIFFLLAGLVVLNTLYLNVLERTHELGLVLALGARRQRVLAMISAEALMLAGLGAMLGSAFGLGLVAWGSGGFHLPKVYEEVYAQIGLQAVLYLSITPWEAVLSAAVMLGVAALAAWSPARRAARLEPVEAMRAA